MTLSTREIPRHRWAAFLDDFSREHLGQRCTLDVDSSVAGIDTEAEAWPLQGVALEHGHGAVRLQVFLGETPDRHVCHALEAPSRMRVEENATGAQRGLRIDADEGAVHLRFVSRA